MSNKTAKKSMPKVKTKGMNPNKIVSNPSKAAKTGGKCQIWRNIKQMAKATSSNKVTFGTRKPGKYIKRKSPKDKNVKKSRGQG